MNRLSTNPLARPRNEEELSPFQCGGRRGPSQLGATGDVSRTSGRSSPPRTAKAVTAFLFFFASLFGAADTARANSILLTESFTGTTAAGWNFYGQDLHGSDASLTAAKGIDPVGSGWLRLTDAETYEAAFVYNDTAIPFGYGIDVTFKFASWGGSGADGFALVLFDGSLSPTSAGGYGGSLGYAQRNGALGLAGGILGIGFDEFGNYSSPTEGRQGGPGKTAFAISVRGPGDGTSHALGPYGTANYGFLTTTGALPSADLQLKKNTAVRPTAPADYREVEIIADTSQIAQGHLPISVILKVGATGTPQSVINNYDAYAQVLAYYGGSASRIPPTIKFGFAGSTGSVTNNHEIQGLEVVSIQSSSALREMGYADVVPEPATFFLSGISLVLLGVSRKRIGARLR